MKKSSIKFLILLCGILLLGVSYVFYNYQEINIEDKNATVFELKAKKINERFSKEVLKIRTDFAVIAEALKQSKTATLFNKTYESDAPFFIIKNGVLVFWSDQKVALTPDLFKGDFTWKVATGKFGVYVLKKESVVSGVANYDIIHALPLFKHYQIQNNYLKSHFNTAIFHVDEVEIAASQIGDYNLLIDEDTFIVSFTFLPQSKLVGSVNDFWIIRVSIGFFLLALYVVLHAITLREKRKIIYSQLFLIIGLVAIRVLMLSIEFPSAFVESNLFDAKLFAYSSVFPSIGDLLFNLVVVFIAIIFTYTSILSSAFYKKMALATYYKRAVVTVVLILISFGSAVLFYEVLHLLYNNSQWEYDITKEIEFTFFEFFYLTSTLLLALIFFFLNRLLLSVIFKLNKRFPKQAFSFFVLSFMLAVLINELTSDVNLFVLLLQAVYLFLVYSQQLFVRFQRFRYGIYVYLILSSITCAGIGTIVIFKKSHDDEFLNKKRFAEQLVYHRDYQGEFFLGELSEEIEEDAFIKDIMTKPFSSKSLVLQKINQSYIGNYFDKYETNIMIYDVNGSPYYKNKLPSDYYDLFNKYNKPMYKTDVNRLFFVNNYKEDNQSKYFKFITLRKNKIRIGYIVINLTLKKINPNSVYPILLQNKKYTSPVLKKAYNYAVYDNNQLMYSAGEFNYDSHVLAKMEEVFSLIKNEFYYRGFHHYAFEAPNGEKVIVSSADSRFYVFTTNFSFFFLVFILSVFLIILFISLFTGYQQTINYSTKIHIYLNLAYLFPLVVVSITTLSIINSSYKLDLEENFQNKAVSISANLISYLEQYKAGELSEVDFQSTIQRLNKYSETDINLFDVSGRLMSTTQPLIYETNLLSKRLNPEAMFNIFHTKHKMVLLDEQIGDFKFKSVYVSMVLQDSGEMLGVLSIPFYNSKNELNDKEIKVFSSIINIFTVAFILILILSFFVSKNLTHPLRLISQKLKKTTLSGENEKLVWNTKDEIGVLVQEYNQMIEKLEESKKALARNEKESAWKEMAQQVAHEIKNPLTPMKLKIQHMQRITPPDDHSQEAFKSLLQQVDTLSDIATSFSTFANMPLPIIKQFNLSQLVMNTRELYKDNDEITLNLELPALPVFVYADQKIIGRIITNIILNGIQAIPTYRHPLIDINMYVNDKQEAVLVFKDNGVGIPADIQDKVFMPNFSTKFTGSGIGLALAKRGVEQVGGRIWFDTKEEEGTTFYIALPMYKKDKAV